MRALIQSNLRVESHLLDNKLSLSKHDRIEIESEECDELEAR